MASEEMDLDQQTPNPETTISPSQSTHSNLSESDGEYKLFCCILEQIDHPFSVKIGRDETVDDLKKAIKKEKEPELDRFPADALNLWQLSPPLQPSELKAKLGGVRSLKETDVKPHELHPVDELSDHFSSPQARPRKHIHIVMEIPLIAERESKRRRIGDGLESVLRRLRAKRLNQIPPLDQLMGVLNLPLADSEKIPISKSLCTSLISNIPSDLCTEVDVEDLFVEGDDDSSLIQIFTSVIGSAPIAGTEDRFHAFWDNNILSLLELLIPEGRSIRNSNDHTQTRNQRPDFGFLIRDICIFRGEEKAPTNNEDPRAELIDKLLWTYDSAPYILGYYARGTIVVLVAIHKVDGRLVVHDLITTDLSLRKNRIDHVRRLINLSPILRELVDLVVDPVPEHVDLARPNCTITILSSIIHKTYNCPDAKERVQHLDTIYHALLENRVPNTDRLVSKTEYGVFLKPRGIPKQPRSLGELRDCITCILDSLLVAHSIPIYHRDIRWPNVIRQIGDPSKWFLIDWEDASAEPTVAQPTFAKQSHSPDVFRDGHGAGVDIWGVGNLIKGTGAAIPQRVRDLGDYICIKSHIMTLVEVVALVKSTMTDV